VPQVVLISETTRNDGGDVEYPGETQEKWERKHLRAAGAIIVVIGMAGAILFVSMISGGGTEPAATAGIGIVGALHLVLGISLAKGGRWPRRVVGALSVIHLLAFPVGTAMGGYVLWVLSQTRRPKATKPSSSAV
jgi:hypothetical protein